MLLALLFSQEKKRAPGKRHFKMSDDGEGAAAPTAGVSQAEDVARSMHDVGMTH